ncbi:MAG: DivIVA domain-containing protein [Actinobacteria bacterium]|nr:DivIVA domain-containing protein [Actinomycetota bacterium]
MKLTPLDIHHKEFKHALRGYSEEEVDAFLDEVAAEFERLFKENIEAEEKVERIRTKVSQYEDMENTLRNTLVTAQRSAEEVLRNSQKEADLIIKDAELKAKEIVQEAHMQKQELQAQLNELRRAEEEFRNRFRALLENCAKSVEDSLCQLNNETKEWTRESVEHYGHHTETHHAETYHAEPASSQSTSMTQEEPEETVSFVHTYPSEETHTTKSHDTSKERGISFDNFEGDDELIYRID